MLDAEQRDPASDASDSGSDDAVDRGGAGGYLIVRLAGREHAVPAAAVRGIIELRSAAAGLLRGTGAGRTALIEARTLPVVPVHQMLGLREKPVAARTCLVVVAYPVQAAHPSLAFIADSVSRIVRVPGRHWREEVRREWIAGQIKLGEKWRGVLDLRRLASAQGLRAA